MKCSDAAAFSTANSLQSCASHSVVLASAHPPPLYQTPFNPGHQLPFYLGHKLPPYPPHQYAPAMAQPNSQHPFPSVAPPSRCLGADRHHGKTWFIEGIPKRGKCGQCTISISTPETDHTRTLTTNGIRYSTGAETRSSSDIKNSS